MYGWEISIRGGNGLVMTSDRMFKTYEEAKEDLVKNIRGEFEFFRCKDTEYNYTIFDANSLDNPTEI